MGGYAALSLMRRRPDLVGALALVDTRASADDDAGRAKRDEARRRRDVGAAAIADAMVPRLLSADSPEAARPGRARAPHHPATEGRDDRRRADRDAGPARLTAALASIAVPTLVVVGDQDALTPPADSEAMAAAVPGARW
jgi:pimeloyl-ACP methyl ester carboxylesterase